MAPLQLKHFIIRRGHRVVLIRRTHRRVGKRRAIKKRRRPQPHRRLV